MDAAVETQLDEAMKKTGLVWVRATGRGHRAIGMWHLWQDGEIFPGDVHAALGLSHDPATRAVELSMIRSGAAPGSFTVTMPGHRRGSGRRWWLLDNLAPHRRSPRPRPTTHQTPDSDLDADREP